MGIEQELQAIVLEWNKIVAEEKRIDEYRDKLRERIGVYAAMRMQLFRETLVRRNLKYCTYRKHVVSGPVTLMYMDFEVELVTQSKLWPDGRRHRNQGVNYMCEHCIEEVQHSIASSSERKTIFFFAHAIEHDGRYYWSAPGEGSSIVDPKFCVFPHYEITPEIAKEYNLPPEIALPIEPRMLKIGDTYFRDTIDTATT